MGDPNAKVNLKLFIDTEAGKVLFAEAGKDFVDFLFYLLSWPFASRFLKHEVVSSLSKLYENIENLSESYLQQNHNKNTPLNIPLLPSVYELHNRKSRLCSKCYSYVAEVKNLLCGHCKQKMTSAFSYGPPWPANSVLHIEGGFAKGLGTFIVMDDLEFMPMSTKNLLLLISKFNIKEVGALTDVDLELGVDEGMKLLKLYLECEKVLTNFWQEKVNEEVADRCKEM